KQQDNWEAIPAGGNYGAVLAIADRDVAAWSTLNVAPDDDDGCRVNDFCELSGAAAGAASQPRLWRRLAELRCDRQGGAGPLQGAVYLRLRRRQEEPAAGP